MLKVNENLNNLRWLHQQRLSLSLLSKSWLKS